MFLPALGFLHGLRGKAELPCPWEEAAAFLEATSAAVGSGSEAAHPL